MRTLRRALRRAHGWYLYGTAVGSVMVLEALAHPALAQVTTTVGGTIDPQTALRDGIPYIQGLCASGIVGICGAKGFAAAQDHRSFLPHALGGAGGCLLTFGAPAALRKFGLPV